MRDATKSLWGPNYPDWVIKRWGKIITQSQIDQGSCTPILTIRLVEEKQLFKTYFNKIEGLSKHSACQGSKMSGV